MYCLDTSYILALELTDVFTRSKNISLIKAFAEMHL